MATKREDDWWDFKQKHQHDKAKLVRDIICMANNRPRRDSYIIFGVEDKTLQIIGVESDTNRRNQQRITDILRSVSFAGGVRPRIEVHTIALENHQLDILVIKDSADVPYYLENNYRDKCIKNQMVNYTIKLSVRIIFKQEKIVMLREWLKNLWQLQWWGCFFL